MSACWQLGSSWFNLPISRWVPFLHFTASLNDTKRPTKRGERATSFEKRPVLEVAARLGVNVMLLTASISFGCAWRLPFRVRVINTDGRPPRAHSRPTAARMCARGAITHPDLFSFPSSVRVVIVCGSWRIRVPTAGPFRDHCRGQPTLSEGGGRSGERPALTHHFHNPPQDLGETRSCSLSRLRASQPHDSAPVIRGDSHR